MSSPRRGSANNPRTPSSRPGSRPGGRRIGPDTPMGERPLGRRITGEDENPAQINPGGGGGGMGGTAVPNVFGQQPKGPSGRTKTGPRKVRIPEGFTTLEKIGEFHDVLDNLAIENRTVTDRETGESRSVPFLVYLTPTRDADGVASMESMPVAGEMFAKRGKERITNQGSETLSDPIHVSEARSDYLFVADDGRVITVDAVPDGDKLRADVAVVEGDVRSESSAYDPDVVSSYIMENQSGKPWTFDKDKGGIPVQNDIIAPLIDNNQASRALGAINDYITTSPEGFTGIDDADAFVQSLAEGNFIENLADGSTRYRVADTSNSPVLMQAMMQLLDIDPETAATQYEGRSGSAWTMPTGGVDVIARLASGVGITQDMIANLANNPTVIQYLDKQGKPADPMTIAKILQEQAVNHIRFSVDKNQLFGRDMKGEKATGLPTGNLAEGATLLENTLEGAQIREDYISTVNELQELELAGQRGDGIDFPRLNDLRVRKTTLEQEYAALGQKIEQGYNEPIPKEIQDIMDSFSDRGDQNTMELLSAVEDELIAQMNDPQSADPARARALLNWYKSNVMERYNGLSDTNVEAFNNAVSQKLSGGMPIVEQFRAAGLRVPKELRSAVNQGETLGGKPLTRWDDEKPEFGSNKFPRGAAGLISRYLDQGAPKEDVMAALGITDDNAFDQMIFNVMRAEGMESTDFSPGLDFDFVEGSPTYQPKPAFTTPSDLKDGIINGFARIYREQLGGKEGAGLLPKMWREDRGNSGTVAAQRSISAGSLAKMEDILAAQNLLGFNDVEQTSLLQRTAAARRAAADDSAGEYTKRAAKLIIDGDAAELDKFSKTLDGLADTIQRDVLQEDSSAMQNEGSSTVEPAQSRRIPDEDGPDTSGFRNTSHNVDPDVEKLGTRIETTEDSFATDDPVGKFFAETDPNGDVFLSVMRYIEENNPPLEGRGIGMWDLVRQYGGWTAFLEMTAMRKYTPEGMPRTTTMANDADYTTNIVQKRELESYLKEAETFSTSELPEGWWGKVKRFFMGNPQLWDAERYGEFPVGELGEEAILTDPQKQTVLGVLRDLDTEIEAGRQEVAADIHDTANNLLSGVVSMAQDIALKHEDFNKTSSVDLGDSANRPVGPDGEPMEMETMPGDDARTGIVNFSDSFNEMYDIESFPDAQFSIDGEGSKQFQLAFNTALHSLDKGGVPLKPGAMESELANHLNTLRTMTLSLGGKDRKAAATRINYLEKHANEYFEGLKARKGFNPPTVEFGTSLESRLSPKQEAAPETPVKKTSPTGQGIEDFSDVSGMTAPEGWQDWEIVTGLNELNFDGSDAKNMALATGVANSQFSRGQYDANMTHGSKAELKARRQEIQQQLEAAGYGKADAQADLLQRSDSATAGLDISQGEMDLVPLIQESASIGRSLESMSTGDVATPTVEVRRDPATGKLYAIVNSRFEDAHITGQSGGRMHDNVSAMQVTEEVAGLLPTEYEENPTMPAAQPSWVQKNIEANKRRNQTGRLSRNEDAWSVGRPFEGGEEATNLTETARVQAEAEQARLAEKEAARVKANQEAADAEEAARLFEKHARKDRRRAAKRQKKQNAASDEGSYQDGDDVAPQAVPTDPVESAKRLGKQLDSTAGDEQQSMVPGGPASRIKDFYNKHPTLVKVGLGSALLTGATIGGMAMSGDDEVRDLTPEQEPEAEPAAVAPAAPAAPVQNKPDPNGYLKKKFSRWNN